MSECEVRMREGEVSTLSVYSTVEYSELLATWAPLCRSRPVTAWWRGERVPRRGLSKGRGLSQFCWFKIVV